MKPIKIQRDAILKPLQAVTGIVEKRHTLPILSNVLLRYQNDQLEMLATDLEIQIATHAEAKQKAAEDQSLTVSARKLQDILRSLPEDTEVGFDIQGSRLQVRAGRSRFNLQTLPANDYPLLAQPGGMVAKTTVAQHTLKELLLMVQFAMAQQDIRYYLNGMLLVIDGETLRVVATDGHRLSYASGTIGAVQEKAEVILPRKAVLELSRLLETSEEPVDVEVYAGQVKFRFGRIELITKVIDGKFPDYTRVIPTNYEKHIVLKRVALLQSLQRAAILSNEKFRGVRWVLTRDALNISCTNNEQEEAQEELEVNYSGDALDVGFNITYLLDLLNNIQCEEVVCGFGDANSSMLMTVADKPEYRYVVMPMRI